MIRLSTDRDAEPLPSTAASRPARAATGSRFATIAVMIVVWVIAGVYLTRFIDRGWISHDDGLLAHTAERVLDGELPHRDFDDTYTGGLAMLHAAAFQLWGVKLTSIRTMLFGFTLLFVPVVYAIAVRAVRPWVAGFVTLVCICWSVPNYFAGLPSWYILFFATFGTAATVRFIDTERSRWLFVAGLCGGAALLIKIVGLYYIAAVLLFLLYREQLLSRRAPPTAKSTAWSLLVTAAATAFCSLLVLLIRRDLRPMEVLHYVVPGGIAAVVLIRNEWTPARGSFGSRLRRLATMVAPFAAGVVLPLALFAIPYIRSGSLAQLGYGVFVLPLKRFQFAADELTSLASMLFVIPGSMLLAAGFFQGRFLRRALAVGLVWATVVLVAFGEDRSVYAVVWFSARNLLPMICLVSCGLLLPIHATLRLSGERRQEIFLLGTAAALLSLMQYPFAAPVYFCYVAPLVILAAVFVVVSQPHTPRRLAFAALSFYLFFAIGWLNLGSVYALGYNREWFDPSDRLDLERGGVRIREDEAQVYEPLIDEVRRRSRPGSYIYAAPDCPEVYFLADRKNPTRTMYDFFDDPHDRSERIRRQIEEKQVEVVVIRLDPEFSHAVDQELQLWVKANFPRIKKVGNFVIAHRGTSSAPHADAVVRASGP